MIGLPFGFIGDCLFSSVWLGLWVPWFGDVAWSLVGLAFGL